MAFVAKLVDRLGRTKILRLVMIHVKDLTANELFTMFKEVVELFAMTEKQLEMVNTRRGTRDAEHA